jgi:hypothetical protein
MAFVYPVLIGLMYDRLNKPLFLYYYNIAGKKKVYLYEKHYFKYNVPISK